MHEGGTPELPAIFFNDAAEFRVWLEQNHASATELWMGLNKAHVKPRGLTWAQAVPEALCFGWIDSTSRRIDDDARAQRWTPRKKGSTWSNVNVAHVERLVAEGRMHPAGLAAFAERRDDRTGTYSFEQEQGATWPERYEHMIGRDPAASSFWESATPSYRRAATHWVLSAKQEATREARMRELVQDCAVGRLVKPQRYGTEPAWARRWRENNTQND